MKVQLLLEAIDKMSGPLKGVQAELDKLTTTEQKSAAAAKKLAIAHGEAMQKIGKGAMVAGAAMTAAVGVSLAAAAQLQDAQAEFQNAFGTDTGMSPFLGELNKQAIEAGNLYPGTTADFLAVGAAYKKAGGDAETMAAGGFKAAAALQVMFHLNPAEAGAMFQKMANSMGIAGKDATVFADSLQRLEGASGLKIHGAYEALKFVGAPLKALKIQGLEASKTVTAMMGVLSKGGLDDSQVGTSLAGLFSGVASIGPRLEHARSPMQKLAKSILVTKGIKLDFFDKNGEVTLARIIQQIDQLKDLNPKEKLQVMEGLFTGEGMRAALLLTTGAVNGMTEAMVHQEGIQARLDRITQALGNKWESVKGSAVNALAAIGTTLTPYLVPVLDKLNGILGAITNLADAHPGLTAAIAGTVGILGSLLLVGGGSLFVFGKMLTGIIELQAALKTLGLISVAGKFSMTSLLASMAPILPLAILISGAAVLMATHWDDVAPAMDHAGESMKHAGTNMRELFSIAGDESKDASKDFTYFAAVAMLIGNTVDQVAYSVDALTGGLVVLKRELLDFIKIPAGSAGSAIAAFSMARESGKGVWESLKIADQANKSTQRDMRIDSREASLKVMAPWKRNPFDFGAQDSAEAMAKALTTPVPGHSVEEVAARKGYRRSMHEQLRQANLSAVSVPNRIALDRLVDTINVTSATDEAAFTAQFMDVVKKKAPELFRHLERQMKIQGRGSFTPAPQGAH